MVIKTLELIHKMLVHDEQMSKAMLKYASEEQSKAQDAYNNDQSEKNKKALAEAKAEAEKRYQRWYDVHSALDDFETQGF